MDIERLSRILKKIECENTGTPEEFASKMKIIYVFLFICLHFSFVLSQNQDVNKKIRATSFPIGDNSSIPKPSDDSERIRYSIKIEDDSAFFSLRADMLEKGSLSAKLNLHEIISNEKYFKGNEIIFEMVPDISNPAKLTLFTYFPSGVITFRYLLCENNKKIKYKKFDVSILPKHGLVPLILCFVDDEQSHIEKLLNRFIKDNLICLTSYDEVQEKMLNHIDECLFVYYNLNK